MVYRPSFQKVEHSMQAEPFQRTIRIYMLQVGDDFCRNDFKNLDFPISDAVKLQLVWNIISELGDFHFKGRAFRTHHQEVKCFSRSGCRWLFSLLFLYCFTAETIQITCAFWVTVLGIEKYSPPRSGSFHISSLT